MSPPPDLDLPLDAITNYDQSDAAAAFINGMHDGIAGQILARATETRRPVAALIANRTHHWILAAYFPGDPALGQRNGWWAAAFPKALVSATSMEAIHADFLRSHSAFRLPLN